VARQGWSPGGKAVAGAGGLSLLVLLLVFQWSRGIPEAAVPSEPAQLSVPAFDSITGGLVPSAGRPSAAIGAPRVAEIADRVTAMIIADEGLGAGYGSGIVLHSDGYILTNKHVVQEAQHLRVAFPDGRRVDAKLWWMSKDHDLALIKAEVTGLSVPEFGDSDQLVRGEEVLASGFPLGSRVGSRSTITRGIVSQIQQMSDGRFVQTDAAINPGNSGGPLFNSRGQVIGINTKRAENLGGRQVVGISWAIPINVARQVVPSLESMAKR
jgi:S1-C subfamily serine protease